MSALGTLGTASTTKLPAFQWYSGFNATTYSAKVLALFNADVHQQGKYAPKSTVFKPLPTIAQGVLYIPWRQCAIQLQQGDVIAADPTTGECFVIDSTTAATSANWHFVAATA